MENNEILLNDTLSEEVEVIDMIEDEVQKEDEVQEAVVPADLGEEEEVKKEEKPVYQPKLIDGAFGIKSKEVIENEEKYRKEAMFKELVAYKKNNTLLWVKLIGVEPTEDGKNVYATTVWEDIRIVIPDSLYFMPDFEFEEGYENLSEEEKARARQKALSYQIGAKICIMIENLSREENHMGDVKYGVIGNRVRAMNLLQFYYFTRPNLPKNEVINVGDKLKANVLSVSPIGVVVECLGVETRLDRHNLSFETVRDCRECVKVGDEIIVRIRKLHINNDEKTGYKNVYLTVSARVRNERDINELIRRDSVYQGVVAAYNPDKKLFTVSLGNGINVSCYQSNNDYTLIRVGDRVSIRITRVNKEFATGRILAVVSK